MLVAAVWVPGYWVLLARTAGFVVSSLTDLELEAAIFPALSLTKTLYVYVLSDWLVLLMKQYVPVLVIEMLDPPTSNKQLFGLVSVNERFT